jgi:hypothetical protein
MLVDLDHLLATPIFEANRCSVGFHPLHSFYAVGVYFVLLFFKRPFNIIGLGLLLHMLTDFIDCLFIYHQCKSCVADSPVRDFLQTISTLMGF